MFQSVGLLRGKVEGVDQFFDVDNNSFGMDLGGGVMGFFSDNVGVRGDVRYFRALTDPEADDEFDVSLGKFRFWRGTAGVIFRF